MSDVLILRHLKVENANAIAGQTWGFPAISNFLGFVHALSRKAKPELGLTLDGCGVICHGSHVQAYQPKGWGDWVFSLTRNPLTKESKTASFVEEGRMSMDVSLVIPVEGRILSGDDQRRELADKLANWVQIQRLAGGSIQAIGAAELLSIPDDEDEQQRFNRKLMRSLLPGFTLVSRTAALTEHYADLQQSQPDAEVIDAWLDFAALKHQAQQTPEDDTHDATAEWHQVPKPANGWIVPIAIGYRGISELYDPGTVSRTRDGCTPFRFVEAVYSIGQWLSPHRITQLDELIWRYDSDPVEGWYLCTNDWQPVTEDFDSSFDITPA